MPGSDGTGEMEFVRCSRGHISALKELYGQVVDSLLAGINYPQWSAEYPAGSVEEAVDLGEQYAVMEDGEILGAVVLSADPAASAGYEAGKWSRALAPGEYLMVHALAVGPQARGRGLGGYIVDHCVEAARRGGYQAVRLDIVPENLPARNLYTRKGFTSAGCAAIDRGLEQVPFWELFEYNLEPAAPAEDQ